VKAHEAKSGGVATSSQPACPLGHVILYSQEYQGTLVARISVLQAACKEGQSLKTTISVLVFMCFAGAAAAQQAAPVRMECRDLPTGNALAPNESLMNGMACHVVGAKQDAAAKSADNVAPQSVSRTPVEPAQSEDFSTPAPVDTRILAGSTIFIVPMEGFENYLAAAIQKKNVPLVPVASEQQARYVLKGTSEEKKPGWAKMVMMKQIHSDNAASVQMIDRKSGAIVFAYSVNKKNTLHGQQTTAEACAKHLKEQIEKK
jgi:TolB-like protein